MPDEVAMGGYAPVGDGDREVSHSKTPVKKLVLIGVAAVAVVLLVVILATTIPSSSSESNPNQNAIGGNQTSPSTRPPSMFSPTPAGSPTHTSPTPAQTSPTAATTLEPTTSAPSSAPTPAVDLAVCTACALPYSTPNFQLGCFVNCLTDPITYSYCPACAAEQYAPQINSPCDVSIRSWAAQRCPVVPTAAPTPAPTSYIPYDPRSSSVVYGMKFACLGDWGVTTDGVHVSTTSGKTTDPAYQRNFDAQKNVARHMTDWSKINLPSFVLSHGDNFYWTGVSTNNDERFRTVFEQMYPDTSLHVPWYNVLGNHDIGGGSAFCGPSCWSCGTKCDNAADMLQALTNKVNAQKTYKSPNKNRWVFEGHYYTKKHFYPVGSTDANADYSIEIFNIDTNAAGDRLPQTCCQCFGNASPDACKNPRYGQPECAGGSEEMYDQCAREITGWWDDSMMQLERDLNRSTATWKVVHNHYLMRYHFSQPQQEQIKRILKTYKVHMFIGGHRHAEGHELIDVTHHIENGGGGGAHMAGGCGGGPGSPCIWSANTYGFVGVKLSKYYMRLEFIADDGGLMHCYHIPVDHSDHASDNGKWNWCS